MEITKWLQARRELESKENRYNCHKASMHRYALLQADTGRFYLVPSRQTMRWQDSDQRGFENHAIRVSNDALVKICRELDIDMKTWQRLNDPLKVAVFNHMVDMHQGHKWFQFIHRISAPDELPGIKTAELVTVTGVDHSVINESWLIQAIANHWMGDRYKVRRDKQTGRSSTIKVPRVHKFYRDMSVVFSSIDIRNTDIIIGLGGAPTESRTNHYRMKPRPCLYISHMNAGGRPIYIIPCIRLGDNMKLITHRKHWQNLRHDGSQQNIKDHLCRALDRIIKNPPWQDLRKQQVKLLNHGVLNARSVFDKLVKSSALLNDSSNHMAIEMRNYVPSDTMTALDWFYMMTDTFSDCVPKELRFDVLRLLAPLMEDPKLITKMDAKTSARDGRPADAYNWERYVYQNSTTSTATTTAYSWRIG